MRAEGALDEQAHYERRILRFAPGDDAEDAGLHEEIEDSDAENRDENRARNIFAGVFHLAAEIADVVVAEIAVNRLHGGVAQAGEENPGEIPGSGRVGEEVGGVEMSGAAVDEPENRAEDDDPKHRGDFADRR